MKNDLTCEVVRDLLPSYVDGLTNDVSNQAVEQHIKICENCQKLYHEMPGNGEWRIFVGAGFGTDGTKGQFQSAI